MNNFAYESFSNQSERGENSPITHAIWLIKEIRQFESTDELLFDYLKVIAENEKHIFLLQRMIESERVHYKILKDIHFQLSGEVPNVDAPTFEIPSSFEEGLSNILLRKSNIVHLYVQLVEYLSPTYSGFLFPIIVEEQTHMQLLNYILIDSCCSEVNMKNTSKDLIDN